MDNKLPKNCMMSEQLWVERSVFYCEAWDKGCYLHWRKVVAAYLWRTTAMTSVRKRLVTRMMTSVGKLVSDEDDDECWQTGKWRGWWGVFANRLDQVHSLLRCMKKKKKMKHESSSICRKYSEHLRNPGLQKCSHTEPFRGWDRLSEHFERTD